MCQKGAPFLIDVMTDPRVKYSEEANCTVLRKAFNTELTTFEYMNLPEQALEEHGFEFLLISRVITGNLGLLICPIAHNAVFTLCILLLRFILLINLFSAAKCSLTS